MMAGDVQQEAIVQSWTTAKFAAIIVGGIFLVLFFLISIVAICVYCRRRNRKKQSVTKDLHEITSTSAPISRRCSPKMKRRTSLPDKISSPGSSDSPNDQNEFSLPPERVQPLAPFEQGRSNNAILEQQYSFIGNIPTDAYASGARTSDDENENGQHQAIVTFSILYQPTSEILTISLLYATDLPGRGRMNTTRNPFVKLYLLPDEHTCTISNTCLNTLSPVFDEVFTFKVSQGELATRMLRISVYDIDKKRVRHTLGHVFVPLSNVDLTCNEVISRPLEKMFTSQMAVGDIQLSLSYMPNDGKIKVIINKARNIHIENPNGMYIKIEFYNWRRLCKTKMTATKKGTFEPEYNESFSFNIRTKQFDACSLVISANMAKCGPFSDDDEYGKVVLGPYTVCRGEQLQHWTEMLANPRQIITKWHHFSKPAPPTDE